MNKGRSQKFIIVCGGQGHGKSTYANNLIKAYHKSGKPCLNVLPDDSEDLFCEYDEIEDIEYLHTIKSGVYNILTDDPKDFLKIKYDKKTGRGFYGGLITIDDGRVFLTSRDEPFRKFIMRRRQGNNDVMFICHGLSEVPPNSSTFATDIVLFGIGDEFDRWTIDHKEKFRPIVKRINQLAIQNPYYYEHYKLRDGNIFDPVTNKQIA